MTGLPRLLIVDDLFGRAVADGPNEDRANLCGQYLIRDVTGDEPASHQVKRPIAEAVFFRGQAPVRAVPGDVVENDVEGTLRVVQAGWEAPRDGRRWSMVLLDLCFYTGPVTAESHASANGMPKGRPEDDRPESYFGLTLLRRITQAFPGLPVVILSSKGREDVSREFSRAGAFGFLPRGEIGSRDLLKEYLWRHGLIPDDSGVIVGTSVPLLAALRAARLARTNQQHVLLRGERGTGKELFARFVHDAARVPPRPFVVVDSGTLTPELFASELFGHVRGAFTGADRDRAGRIAEANGGDLFLDEIGNMPAGVQRGLLRVIERRELTRVGSTMPQSVDVRMISATNRDIERTALQDGEFLPDLLDRLKEGGTVVLPPLRERKEDIPMLVAAFVRSAEQQFGAMFRHVEDEAIHRLQMHDWPGNVRELRNVIYDAISRHRDVEHLAAAHVMLPAALQSARPGEPAAGAAPAPQAGDALDAALAQLVAVDPGTLDIAKLEGVLPRVEAAVGRLKAALVKRAFEAHIRRGADAAQTKVLVQPALALLRGEPRLSATQAYDAIIRLHNEYPATGELWDADPVLADAYQRSVANRRRGPRRGDGDAAAGDAAAIPTEPEP